MHLIRSHPVIATKERRRGWHQPVIRFVAPGPNVEAHPLSSQATIHICHEPHLLVTRGDELNRRLFSASRTCRFSSPGTKRRARLRFPGNVSIVQLCSFDSLLRISRRASLPYPHCFNVDKFMDTLQFSYPECLMPPKGKAWIGLDHVIDKYGTASSSEIDRAQAHPLSRHSLPNPNGVPLASLIAASISLPGITAPPDQKILDRLGWVDVGQNRRRIEVS